MSATLCVVCGVRLPLVRRSDRRYCSSRCQMRAYRLRVEAVQRPPRKPRRCGHPAADASEPLAQAASQALLGELQHQLDAEREQRQKQDSLIVELREQLGRETATRSAREDTHQKQIDTLHQQVDRATAETDAARTAMRYQAEQSRQQEQLTKSQIEDLRGQLSKARAAETRAKDERIQAELALNRARKELEQLRQKAEHRAAVRQEQTETLALQVCDLQSRLDDAEQRCDQLKAAPDREAALTAENQQLKRQLAESRSQNRKLSASIEHDCSPADAVRSRKTETGFLRPLATAFLSGAMTGLGTEVGKRLGEGAPQRARQALPPAQVEPETVQLVVVESRLDEQRLSTKPARRELPPKTEDWDDGS